MFPSKIENEIQLVSFPFCGTLTRNDFDLTYLHTRPLNIGLSKYVFRGYIPTYLIDFLLCSQRSIPTACTHRKTRGTLVLYSLILIIGFHGNKNKQTVIIPWNSWPVSAAVSVAASVHRTRCHRC